MDSNTLLDYALFHLTPTRTRCDLVVFCGGKSEKLASGLVEPFVSHLKFAKDQILKGGYSITLRPPTADAFWFTKHTFQRFVRFVSTPEILERFIHIEREISQIASSIQSNEILSPNSAGHEEEGGSAAANGVTNKTPDSYKSKHKSEVADGAAPEENSKFRLQRLLNTRKLLLLKEQAMVYARAKAAGFGMDRMDELIYFSDAFGASRLREACTNFRDLNKQKHSDVQWMHELAAMEACPPNELSYLATSGITLAFDNNDTNLGANGTNSDTIADKDSLASHQTASTPPKMPLNMPWPNPGPQYMHNYQIPIQQFPPYHGYPIPGMHPYYPGHVHHPSTGIARETSNYKSRKSSKKREKHANVEGSETSEEDEESESSLSNSGTDTEESNKRDKKRSPSERSYVKRNKKSSKTVVIRNINYITSKRRNGENDTCSEEGETLDEDAIKKHVVDAVTSFDKHRHSKANKNKNGFEKDIAADVSEGGGKNENWNAFQSLLMSREESSPKAVSGKRTLDFEDQFSVNNSYNNSFTNGHIDLESEKVKVQHLTTDASVILTQRDGCDEGRINMVDMGNVEEINPSMKRRGSEDVKLLPSRQIDGSGSDSLGMISDFGAESSLIRNGNRDDWFVVNRSEDLEIHETKHSNFYERKNLSSEKDWSHMEGYNSIDDSLMVQSRPAFDDQRDSEWKTDINMVADLTTVSPSVNGGPKDVCRTEAPDDLCVVLVRDSMESTGSWTREMDYGIENSYTEADRRSSVVEKIGEETQDVECKSANGKKGASPAMKSSGKDTRSKILKGSLAKSNADNSLKTKKTFPTSRLMGQRSKNEKEEDMRKRLEELTIQRQKRIAERTAASKKVQTGNKSASAKPKTMLMNSGKDVKNQLKKTSLKANGLVHA